MFWRFGTKPVSETRVPGKNLWISFQSNFYYKAVAKNSSKYAHIPTFTYINTHTHAYTCIHTSQKAKQQPSEFHRRIISPLSSCWVEFPVTRNDVLKWTIEVKSSSETLTIWNSLWTSDIVWSMIRSHWLKASIPTNSPWPQPMNFVSLVIWDRAVSQSDVSRDEIQELVASWTEKLRAELRRMDRSK